MTPDRHIYRTVPELLVAVRDHHRLSQRQLAERSGVAQAQLARYESGTADPGLRALRKLLRGVGWLPTLGVEPTTAALDEQLDQEPFVHIDLLLHLRVCMAAEAAGARVVVGGEVTAVLQGVPLRTMDMCIHVLDANLPVLLAEAHRNHLPVSQPDDEDARYQLGRPEAAARVEVVPVLPPAGPSSGT